MIGPGRVLRLLRIAQVFLRHGLDDLVTSIPLFRPYRWLLHALPWRWRRSLRTRPRGQRLREALEDLGPIFVKLGQMLSTRPDLLPEDIAAELSLLQDRVTPFPGAEARKVIETAYGEPLDRYFSHFDEQPIASASVAQVHGATLTDGTEVVVKVLRPGMERVIDRDLALMYTVARLVERYWEHGPRLRPVEVIDEYNKTIHDELDLMREAANASRLRSNFEGSDLIYVPLIHWEQTRREVMVMERIEGIPIRDVAALRAAGIDMRRLAHEGVEIFFTQAFRDGFFHADMHPGNIFVAPEGQYRAVDFGIMGSLGDSDKRYLAENFLAFFNRDYRAVAEAHLRAGWVPADTRVEEFESAIRTVCEPIFARPLSEISFGRLVVRLFQTARRFNMPVQPQLVLLQKTLLNIEGLGRQLYPELDLWQTAKPYLEDWMRQQVGPRAVIAGLRRELPALSRMAPEMPGLVYEFLRRARDEELRVRRHDVDVEAERRGDLQRQRRLFGAVVGSALMVSASVLYAFADSDAGQVLAAAGGTAGILIAVLAWPRRRR